MATLRYEAGEPHSLKNDMFLGSPKKLIKYTSHKIYHLKNIFSV